MNGVEILKETAIYENTFPGWLLCLLFFCTIISCIVEMCAFIYYQQHKDKVDKYLGIFFLGLTVVGVALIAFGLSPDSTPAYTEYEVTIDDSVSFNKFTEKYEIIDQEGKIYTVKEK